MRCSPHGLRKAAGRRLAEAGCTPHQIASILGHKTLSETMRYTQSARQKTLAQQAIGKYNKLSSRK
ncbi:tyrosine-type recombinase/integrase [Acetobacter sp. P5B1]|uniref:tyrosine-type recombinase/integrase n=1 Tax=Acetobacter sp. P5B1 TaxID=2762620 RepID=UPI001C03F483